MKRVDQVSAHPSPTNENILHSAKSKTTKRKRKRSGNTESSSAELIDDLSNHVLEQETWDFRSGSQEMEMNTGYHHTGDTPHIQQNGVPHQMNIPISTRI